MLKKSDENQNVSVFPADDSLSESPFSQSVQ